MAKRTPSRKTLLFVLSICIVLLLPSCGDDGQTITQGNTEKSTPKEAEIRRNADTTQLTFHKDSNGDISKISTSTGFDLSVTYSGGNITSIGDNNFASYDAEGRIIEITVDYGAQKVRTEKKYLNDTWRPAEVKIISMLRQSDGSYTEEPVAEATDIQYGSQNQGSFDYTTYNGGVVRTNYEGKFWWNDTPNNLQDFAPYSMMPEFTDYFNSVTNALDRCFTLLELTDVNDTTNKTTYEGEYYFGANGVILKRKVTMKSLSFTTEVEQEFTY